MIKVLHEDEWITVSFDEARRLVRYTRSSVPYGDAKNLDRSLGGAGALAAQIPRGMKLLVDLRRAPPRNDDAFEAKTSLALAEFLPRFAKHATLMSTAVGKLQAARMARARGVTARAFEDEAAALAYLDGD